MLATRVKEKSCHPAINNGDGSIIIQFILLDLIQAFKLTSEIEKSFLSIQLTKTKKLSKSGKAAVDQITAKLTGLVGQADREVRQFSWNPNKSVLSKLKVYYALLGNEHNLKERERASLQKNTELAGKSATEFLDLIGKMCDTTSDQAVNLSEGKTLLETLNKTLQQFAKMQTKFLLHYRRDESVLYFILRHHVCLDAIYEKNFVVKFFSKIFQGGIGEAKLFMTIHYISRGFEHVALEIDKKFSELDVSVV